MIWLVAPAYNEERNIARLVESVDVYFTAENLPYHLIVVDDGSRDGTAQIVRDRSRRFSCSLISYQPNRGVDEAFRRGLSEALSKAQAGDIVVTLEADSTADLNLLKAFFGKIENGCGLVVASYYAEGGRLEGTAWHRKVLSRCGNGLIGALFRVRGIHTYSSFYRAYRPEALKAVRYRYGDFFEEKGFACVVELLIRIHRAGFRVEEVPMVLEGSRRVGKSKMKVFKTIMGYLRIVARNAFRKS